MNSFLGFKNSDFLAFTTNKLKAKKFNKERKIVWQKMKSLKLLVDSELAKIGFPLEGTESKYDINYIKRKVNGIWVAYTHIKPYYRVCQLNYGIYRYGFFIGIELRSDSKEHITNMLNFVKNNPDEFLNFGRNLNRDHMDINYDICEINPENATISDLEKLVDTINSTNSWFRYGEWYYNKEKILKTSEIVAEIIRVFEILYPLYLIFSGVRPAGNGKIDKLQRTKKVLENELEQKEIELKDQVSHLSKQEIDESIKKSDERNNLEGVLSYSKQANSYKRDANLASTLKTKYGDQCQICKQTFNVKQGYFCDTHHIKALKDGGKDVSKNILVVCPTHHRLLDRRYIEVISRTNTKLKINENGKITEIQLD
ncbi:MAG: HNH endonuclease [Candidatus Bathyarchaeota archaeon]|nr:MAG: HNH endonuclease [Candidatus Bathyarchaeota archaeon]